MSEEAPGHPEAATFTHLATERKEVLTVTESFRPFAQDDFCITNDQSETLFTAKGKFFTLSGRKLFYGKDGNHLFDVVRKLSFKTVLGRSTYAATCAKHGTILTVNPKCEPRTSAKYRAHLKLNNALVFRCGAKVTVSPLFGQTNLKMQGDRRHSIISFEGRHFAELQREYSARELLGAQKYSLTVYPGANKAIAAAMCVIFDELYNDKQGK